MGLFRRLCHTPYRELRQLPMDGRRHIYDTYCRFMASSTGEATEPMWLLWQRPNLPKGQEEKVWATISLNLRWNLELEFGDLPAQVFVGEA